MTAADLPPGEFRFLAAQVDGLTRAGRWAEAESACAAALGRHPTDASLLQMLGIVRVRAGRVAEALDPLRRAAAGRPTAAAYMSLGMALLSAGDPMVAEETVSAFAQASALRPGYAEADLQWGHALAGVGRSTQAADAYGRALAARPNWAAALIGLGNARYAQRRLPEALDCYRRAAAADPADANAPLNAGIALAAQGRRPEAIGALRHALSLSPGSVLAAGNLATTLYLDGQLDEAETMLRRLLAERPADEPLLANLAGLLKDKGRLDESIELGRRAVAADPRSIASHSNLVYTLSFHPGYTPADVLAAAREYDRMHAAALTAAAAPHANDRSPERRLRVGYVSPDLRQHAVGRFLLPLVEHHDPDVVDVRLYALGVTADDLTERLKRAAGGYRELAGLSSAQAAEAIRGDGIDVLVDLTLHMGHNRLPVFARRPAPVQATYLAYAGTSGLTAMDYRLSDPYLDPTAADEADYSERTVRLPRTYWCYRPAVDVAMADVPPVEAAGVVTFASLNNFCKVNDGVLAAWAEVLAAVPGSRLLLHAEAGDHRAATVGRLVERGVSADRVGFVGRVRTADYLALYNRVDVGLDPFPYNGGTTTLDALWMGVPVVSLAADRAVGRAGRSILSNVGLPELVADDVAGYVRTAVALATDRSRLAELRRTMRGRMQRSPVMDAAAFARDVEAAYRRMWRAWCDQDGRQTGV